MPKTNKVNLFALLVNWFEQFKAGFLAGKKNFTSPAKQKSSIKLAAALAASTAIIGVGVGLMRFLNSNLASALLPSITSLSQTSGPEAGDETITIAGEDFTKRADFHPNIAALAGDATCAVALETGQAYCWGGNNLGQVGNGDDTMNTTPTPMAVDTTDALAGKTIKQLSGGNLHICAVASDDLAYCWGYDRMGQLGDDHSVFLMTHVPVAVDTSGALAGKTIKQIDASNDVTCAIASDDQAYCWGKGALGNEGRDFSPTPLAVDTSGALAGKAVKQISTGGTVTCAIAFDDLAYCWGSNDFGSVGNNSAVREDSPVAVDTSDVLAGKTIKQIALADSSACVLASDDNVYCWGNNEQGQLGNDSYANSPIPVAVDTSGALAGKTVKQIAGAGQNFCAIASDNQAYCWGDNFRGQLGADTTDTSPVPIAVDTSGALFGKTIEQIFVGFRRGCVTTSDGKLYCWGENARGQLGDGTSMNYRSTPVEVDSTTLPIVPNITSVLFGSVPATSFTIDSANQLTAITPPHPAGLVDVALYNAKNRPVVLAGAYEFLGNNPIVTPPVAPQTPLQTPETPKTGVGSSRGAIVALAGTILAATGLSLAVYYKTIKKPRWFK